MIKENHKYFDWLYKKKRYYHLFNISSGLFVWIFLWITQPFGISDNNLDNFFLLGLFILLFGLVWILNNYLVDFIYFRLTPWKNRESGIHSLFSWIIKVIVQVHSIYFLRTLFCEGPCIDVQEYFQLWLAVITLFLLMYIPFSLFGRYLYYHSLLGVSQTEQTGISLKGEGKETLHIKPDEIIYMKSDDNYVDIFKANPDYPGEKIIFRATLKSIEEQLSSFIQFKRTHRSVLINLKYVSSNYNDENQLKVKFKEFEEEIPVSKSYSKQVSDIFIHPK